MIERSDTDPTVGVQHPAHVGLMLGLFSGALLVVVAIALGLPGPSYLPETGRWGWGEVPGVIAMHYYGVPLWGAGGFAVGLGLGRVAKIATILSTRAGAQVLTLTAAGTVVVSLAYCLIVELTRWGGQ